MGAIAARSDMWVRSFSGPRAQLMPTLNRSKCSRLLQQASTVWAESVRPPSKTVNDAITGSRTPVSMKTCSIA